MNRQYWMKKEKKEKLNNQCLFFPSPICSLTQVQLGQVEIKCPITECFEFLEETTVIYNLTHEDSIKYKYFLELGRIDSSTKPCPQCKHFTTFKKKGHIPTPSRSIQTEIFIYEMIKYLGFFLIWEKKELVELWTKQDWHWVDNCCTWLTCTGKFW